MSSASGLPTLAPSSSASGNSPSNTATGRTGSGSASGSPSATASASQSATASRGSQSISSASNLPTVGASSTADPTSVSVITGAPSLSTASQQNGPILSLSGLPTLAGAFSYPPASVPPTSNAPFMKTTLLPENFVFIVVGGVLAFILLIVVLWRSITAWSVNRRFKRDLAAMYTPLPDLKKKHVKTESGMPMADLSDAKLPKSFNSVPSLFFSPTAEVARQSMIRPGSQHMPSGHYRDASK